MHRRVVLLNMALTPTSLCLHTPLPLFLSQGLDEGTKDEKSAGAKRKWYEEKQKRKEEELVRLGLDPSQSHRWGALSPLPGDNRMYIIMTRVCI